jgi:hypothetical protein
MVISALVIATVNGLPLPTIFREPFQPVQFCAVAISLSLAGVIYLLRTRLQLSRSDLAAIGLFLMLPYAFAFGSGNSYGTTAARGTFLVPGRICCLRRGRGRCLAPAASHRGDSFGCSHPGSLNRNGESLPANGAIASTNGFGGNRPGAITPISVSGDR